jgi:hypothetical protein
MLFPSPQWLNTATSSKMPTAKVWVSKREAEAGEEAATMGAIAETTTIPPMCKGVMIVIVVFLPNHKGVLLGDSPLLK